MENIQKDINFLIDYQNKFVEMANNHYKNKTLNIQLYNYLIEKSNKTEILLGQSGRVHYMSPFVNYTIPNYPIVNTIPKFKTGTLHDFDISSSDNALVRKVGILKERQKTLIDTDNLKTWFQIGSRTILSFPIILLSFFGIISTNTLQSFTSSPIFKAFTGIVWLLSLLGTIITIITGWDTLFNILKQYI